MSLCNSMKYVLQSKKLRQYLKERAPSIKNLVTTTHSDRPKLLGMLLGPMVGRYKRPKISRLGLLHFVIRNLRIANCELWCQLFNLRYWILQPNTTQPLHPSFCKRLHVCLSHYLGRLFSTSFVTNIYYYGYLTDSVCAEWSALNNERSRWAHILLLTFHSFLFHIFAVCIYGFVRFVHLVLY